MTRRIFILNGHPAETSLNGALADAYAAAARAAGHEVRQTHLAELDFDMDHGLAGYGRLKPLEPALETLLADIEWSEHVVLTAPMWWGGLPAKLKGAIDRAFLPGRAFDTAVPRGRMPKPLLGGRSARVILTSDTPKWVLSLVHRNSIIHQLRGHILGFVGIRPVRVTYLSGASHAGAGRVRGWLARISGLGAAAA